MRHIYRSPIVVLLALVILLVLLVASQAQGVGVLEGQVVNGTAGAPEVGAGMPVLLQVYQAGTRVDSLETTTAADGSFRFEELGTDAGFEYWPEVTYLDVAYSSAEPFRFDSEQALLSAAITVFETTEDENVIGLESVHLIAESFGEVLRVSEIHLYSNSGDRTYVGRLDDNGQLTTVFIPLPEDAVGLAFQEGTPEGRFVEVAGGVADTEPVPPGQETSLAFLSYHLMVTGNTIPLERRFAYPVTNLNVLVAQPGLTLSSDQLEARGTELLQGRQYEFHGTQNLTPDTSLVMELLPQEDVAASQETMPGSTESVPGVTATSPRGNQELLRWLGFGLVALAVIAPIFYAAAGRRSASAPTSPNLTKDPESRRLVAELADLEEAFEAGQVDDATYERQRTEIYEALQSL